MEIWEYIAWVAAAYLIGSVPFGYLAGRVNGIDLREHGSHNIGATNAVRVLGKRWGIPVFFCDFLKGYVPPALLIGRLGCSITEFDTAQMGLFLAVLAAVVLGHTFTCFLHFRGGKGVATTAGALFALSLWVGGAAVLVWVLCMLLTRYVSLSSLVAGLGMMVAAAMQFAGQDGTVSTADAMLLGLLGLLYALVIVKHRSNIVRLIHGTEPKAFSKH